MKLNEYKNGKGQTGYNLYLKPKEGVESLALNESVIVEKVFAEGMKKMNQWDKPYYICQAKYEDKSVSFLLSDKEHEEFKTIGGIGAKVKITLTEEPVEYFTGKDKKTKQRKLTYKLKFELV